MKPACAAVLAAALLILPLAGCVSTPAQRISKNQALFDSLPAAAQTRIRSGQIDLGYTPDMVRLAFGEPRRMLVRRTAESTTEVWDYVDTTYSYDRQRVSIDGLSVHGPNGTRTTGGGAWITVLQEKEVLRARVEFTQGTVCAIEESPAGAPGP